MATPKPIVAVALAALALAACNKAGGASAGASNSLCKPFTTASAQGAPAATALPGAASADPSAALDDCLHRWGYALAASSDPANLVADATLAACSQALSGWNQASLSTSGTMAPVEAPSLMNGQPTNPLAEHHAFAEGRALFYVVQARAGHCAPPPAANGAPAGRTG